MNKIVIKVWRGIVTEVFTDLDDEIEVCINDLDCCENDTGRNDIDTKDMRQIYFF